MKEKSVPSDYYDKEYYLELAEGGPEFKDYKGDKLTARLIKSLSLADITSECRVLDIGCGRGEIVRYCAEQGAYVTGIDYSKDAIDLAKGAISDLSEETQKRVVLELADAKKMPYESSSFDVIFFLDVIEHLYPEEVESILSEIYRVLKDEGRLIIHTMPNRLFYDYGYRFYTRYVNSAIKLILGKDYLPTSLDPRTECEYLVHINEQTPFSIRKYLDKAGFDYTIQLRNIFKPTIKDKLYFLLSRFWPISILYPLNLIFCNDIYVKAWKRS